MSDSLENIGRPVARSVTTPATSGPRDADGALAPGPAIPRLTLAQDASSPRRVLMIAYHFPPVRGSSGVQRTLRFARDLPGFGWEPAVLSVSPRAYPTVGDDLLNEIPEGLLVERAFALDAARHLAIGGRYPRRLAMPDRWATWWPAGVARGLKMIRRFRPDVIWSTFPIATAHLIGLTLHRLTGLPWVADFRDPMGQSDYPADPAVRRIYRRIEAATVTRCDRVVFTAPTALRRCAERYPEMPDDHWVLIENGYDEARFRAVESEAGTPGRGGPLRLLHSGLLYPDERDPSHLFRALSDLVEEGALRRDEVRIVLRASGNERTFRALADRHGLNGQVELAPVVGYGDALKEMLEADGLLLLQDARFDKRIPAKLYEYFRARRPILGLVHPGGDTANAMRDAGVNTVAPIDSVSELKPALLDFTRRIRSGDAPLPRESSITRATREARAGQLAEVMEAAL
jgi:hypothetical protein